MRCAFTTNALSSPWGGWRSPQPSPTTRRRAATRRTAPRALAELVPVLRHLAEHRRDHPEGREGGQAAGAREVVEADLDDRAPRLLRAEQELGVDEAAVALQREPREHG